MVLTIVAEQENRKPVELSHWNPQVIADKLRGNAFDRIAITFSAESTEDVQKVIDGLQQIKLNFLPK